MTVKKTTEAVQNAHLGCSAIVDDLDASVARLLGVALLRTLAGREKGPGIRALEVIAGAGAVGSLDAVNG